MIFFTSDQHYGHHNIITYSKRPFSDVYEMNEALILNWNKVVTDQDIVYIIGDFSMNPQAIPKFLPRLNRKEVHLISGNHDKTFKQSDKWVKQYLNYGFDSVSNLAELKIANKDVLLMHLPYKDGRTKKEDKHVDFRLEDQGKFALVGHVHTVWKTKGNQINVGVDVWDYTPVSIIQIEKEINKIVSQNLRVH